MKIINSTLKIGLSTIGCYAAGYVYGAACRVNRTLAARAFAIAVATQLTFNVLTELATGGKKKNAKKFYIIRTVGDAVLAALFILTFRHLRLMGPVGTACFTFAAGIILLHNIHKLKN